MANPSSKKDSPVSSTSPSLSAFAPSRLNKITVLNAISQLHNARGSTVQSVLSKLQRRSGCESISREMVKKAIDRLVEASMVKEVANGRFSVRAQTKRSAARAPVTPRTKTDSTAVKASNPVTSSTATAGTVGVKTRSSKAWSAKAMASPSKAPAAAVTPARAKTSVRLESRQKADRDGAAHAELANDHLREKRAQVISVEMDGSLKNNRQEGSQLDAISMAVSPRRLVDQTSTEHAGNMDAGRASFMQPSFGPGSMLRSLFRI